MKELLELKILVEKLTNEAFNVEKEFRKALIGAFMNLISKSDVFSRPKNKIVLTLRKSGCKLNVETDFEMYIKLVFDKSSARSEDDFESLINDFENLGYDMYQVSDYAYSIRIDNMTMSELYTNLTKIAEFILSVV